VEYNIIPADRVSQPLNSAVKNSKKFGYYAMKKCILIIFLLTPIVSCGGESSESRTFQNYDLQIEFNFNSATDGWEADFADYPAAHETLYELTSQFTGLPHPLESSYGLNVSGNNHSDDLFMFIKKKITGFEPNAEYRLQFEITFASNVPKGCFGVGGSPGESVIIKAGAAAIEPLPYIDDSGYYRMNLDKGNQAMGGSDAISIGNFANSKICEDDDFSYELKTLNSSGHPFSVFTNSDGALWLLFGTDSGFEATTSIYYISGRLLASKV
jgi:hypothetical protein